MILLTKIWQHLTEVRKWFNPWCTWVCETVAITASEDCGCDAASLDTMLPAKGPKCRQRPQSHTTDHLAASGTCDTLAPGKFQPGVSRTGMSMKSMGSNIKMAVLKKWLHHIRTTKIQTQAVSPKARDIVRPGKLEPATMDKIQKWDFLASTNKALSSILIPCWCDILSSLSPEKDTPISKTFHLLNSGLLRNFQIPPFHTTPLR